MENQHDSEKRLDGVSKYKMKEELRKIKDEIEEEYNRCIDSLNDYLRNKYRRRKPIKSNMHDDEWSRWVYNIIEYQCEYGNDRKYLEEFFKGSFHVINEHLKKGNNEKCKDCDDDVWEKYYEEDDPWIYI